MTFIRNLFTRRTPDPVTMLKQEDPLAFYLGGDGRMSAVKSGSYTWTMQTGRTSLGVLFANAEQYARAAIASVWAANCINLRADTMARLIWLVRDRVTQKEVENHPFTLALRNSHQNVMRRLEWSQMIWGETFIKPLLNADGYHSGFHVLNNLDMEVDTSKGYVTAFRYTPQGAGKSITYPPEQLVFIRTDNPFDDYRGLSKFEHCLLEIDIDQNISRTTASFYKNDARPGVLLIPEHDLTKERAAEVVEFWNSQFQGPDKKGKTALIPTAIKEVRDFQRAPSLDEVDLRESTRREICAAFKVPLSMAGAWDDATYQSLPEQRKFFYEETIIPQAEQHARDLTQKAFPFFDDSDRLEVFFNADAILSLVENVAEKVDIATKKLTSGAYTINEVRDSLGDDPIEGGDIHIMQSGWIPVRSTELATYDAPNTAPTEDPLALPAPQGNNEQAPDAAAFYTTTDTIEVRTIHAAALDELKAWQKFHANGTATKRTFETYMIAEDIATDIRAALLLAGNNREVIKSIFREAESRVALKQADAIRSNFELEIKTLISIGKRREISRLEFTNRLKQAIRRFGADAYRAGLTDGGVITPPNEPLETEDAAIYEGLYAEQAAYATGLSAQVYEDNLTDAQALLKPRQWWSKSMQPFYDAALLSANRNGMVEIVGVIDGNSCPTCRALVGQRHRRYTIMAAGLMPPYGSAIVCSDGGLCRHRAISVNSRARGNLSRVPRHA